MLHSQDLHDLAEGDIMGFMSRQCDVTHRVRKTAASGVVEPDQRLVIAVMAIGIIAGALLTPSSGDTSDSKAAPVKATATR